MPMPLPGPQVDRIVFLLAWAAFASSAALRLVDPMLPALAADFHTTVGGAAIVVTATGLAYGLLQLLFGPLGDHYGKLRVITIACLASTLGAVACAVSPSLDLLALARALNGATTAALIPLSLAWIGDAVSMEHRQATLARFMTGQIIGLVSGHAIGGFFAEHLGWRWGFVFLAGIYLVVGLLLLAALRGARVATPAPARLPGRYRLVLGQAHGRFVLALIFVEAIATFGIMTFIPAYLHQRFGVSLLHAGLVVATVGLGGLGYTLFAARWVRVLGPRRLARSGGVLLGVAFATLTFGDAWAWGVLACVLLGLGFYQLHNTLQTLASQMAPQARGTALSLFAFCFFLGQAAGAALGAPVVDHFGAQWLFLAAALMLPLTGFVLASHIKARHRALKLAARGGAG
ncbi:MAG: major facilitator superfamily transporter [bacterium]|nr:MAG: major facilitator superfamily transporter [bacterium]KAF0147163.1 MAG: major facilitator superfamily transporter [bacterium]KAF0165243.1 MAG: major facilitator superfamily transporter [bacterium]